MFRRILFTLLTAFLLTTLSKQASAENYLFNQEKSEVRFSLKHLGVVTVKGDFKSFAGEFNFHPDHIEKSRVALNIDAASVATKNKTRDTSLRSKNFFWADTFPQIRFVSKEIKNIRDNTFDIHGELTIRGITNPAVFRTTLLPGKDSVRDESILHFKTETTIKRKDYHLGTENWLDPIMLITNENLNINLDVFGIPSPQ